MNFIQRFPLSTLPLSKFLKKNRVRFIFCSKTFLWCHWESLIFVIFKRNWRPIFKSFLTYSRNQNPWLKKNMVHFFFSHMQFLVNYLLDEEENTPHDNLGEYVWRLMFVVCIGNFTSGLVRGFGNNIGRIWCSTTNQIIIREK